MILKNAFKHFMTITKHRNKVMVHCFKAGIPVQGFLHDLSKYGPEEFLRGIKYFQGTRSPHEAEREINGFSLGWMHHKGRNKHHFEYWTDYSFKAKQVVPVKMPLKYVKEMFCDRVAACKIYKKDAYTPAEPLNYYLKSKGYRVIHADTAELLEKLLVMLNEKGEAETFEYIKKLKEY